LDFSSERLLPPTTAPTIAALEPRRWTLNSHATCLKIVDTLRFPFLQ